jgi:hypothetical protein
VEKRTVVLTLFQRRSRPLTLLLALVGPVIIAALLSPFRGSFADTAAALVLIAAVVALAVAGGRGAGYLSTVMAALWFDFFLTRPYDRFAISHRPAIETTVAIVVVGVLVTELAARSRHHARTSNAGFGYVEAFETLSALAAGPTPSSQILERVSSSLVGLLDLRACRFERLATNPPLARVLADGVVDHVGLAWPAMELGIPGPEAEILAEWRGRILGRFVLTPTPGAPVSAERLSVAVSLATLAAATLDHERRSV